MWAKVQKQGFFSRGQIRQCSKISKFRACAPVNPNDFRLTRQHPTRGCWRVISSRELAYFIGITTNYLLESKHLFTDQGR